MRITPTIIFIFFALYILECELRQLVTVFDDSSCTKLIGFYYHGYNSTPHNESSCSATSTPGQYFTVVSNVAEPDYPGLSVYRASFNNVSCPIAAPEATLGGVHGVCINVRDSFFFRIEECISSSMTISTAYDPDCRNSTTFQIKTTCESSTSITRDAVCALTNSGTSSGFYVFFITWLFCWVALCIT